MFSFDNVICITDRHLCKRPFQEQMKIVAEQKPKYIVLREKDVMEDTYRLLVERIQPVCEEYDIPLILHSHADLALELGIPNLQISLPKLRELPEETRRKFRILGTTVHSPEDAKEAEALGATYVTASLVTNREDKYGTGNTLLDFLEEVSAAVDIPVYALGGASRKDMDEILSRGAAGMCMMSRLMTWGA